MTSTTSTGRDGLWSPERRALTLGLVLTITLVAFESLAISTVMPIVADELGDRHLYGWVFSAFFLGSLLGIILVGGLVDRGGLVPPFLLGLGLFAIGLVAGGLAPSMPVLVAARFVQGLGAGAIPPIAYVAIGRSLPERLRPPMFAMLSTAWVLPGVIGPALAGVVGEHLGWRWVFLGLLPMIALAGALTVSALAQIRRGTANGAGGDADAAASAAARVRSLLPAALVVTLGAALATAGLTEASLVPGGPLLLIGILLFVPAFRRLTPPGTLRAARGLPAAVLLRGILTFTFFCVDAFVPLALRDWRGTSASIAGIALTAATLSWTAGSWIQARRHERLGTRRFVRTGFAIVGLGILGFTVVLFPQVPLWVAILMWGVTGLGMGLSYAPLSLTVLAEAPRGEEGAATSGLQLSDVLGTALGTGVGGALIAATDNAGLSLAAGLAAIFAVSTATAVVGTLLTTRLPGPRPLPRRAVPEQQAA